MNFTSTYFIPDSICFTVTAEKHRSSESEAVFETMKNTLVEIASGVFDEDVKQNDSTAFKRKIIVADGSNLVTEFGSAKDMMMYYTGMYDRNLHYSAYKHFINTHLLHGRFHVEHIWACYNFRRKSRNLKKSKGTKNE